VPRVENGDLKRWRAMGAAEALLVLADHCKRDPTFEPIKDKSSTRWHATVCGKEFELLLTGSKFFDTRSAKGGGGAIDLAMHLFQVDFKAAAGLLRNKAI